MTTTSIGSNPSAAGGITAPADPWAPDPGAQPLSDTAIDAPSGEHPLAKLGLGDLHPFALPGEATQMLAPFQPPAGERRPAAGPVLYDDKQGPGSQGKTELAAVKPGLPMDLQQMEKLAATAKAFDVRSSPIKADKMLDDLKDAKRHFQAALDALKAGDYKQAANQFRYLGMPLPPNPSDWGLTPRQAATVIVLGARVVADGNHGVRLADGVKWGARGFQPLNDLNSFAANAIMIDRLSALKSGMSNPPTEAQVTQYMRDFVQVPKGAAPRTPQETLQAASEITSGLIIHYSSAGQPDPVYGLNPNPRYYYKDAGNVPHDFASQADALNAAKAGKPPIGNGEKIRPLIARSPDDWSDISTHGSRAGANVGDCESKVFVQTRLLTAAGFTPLGSVDVQHGKDSGHMFGVFKAPDGTIWVTSNEEFRQVKPAVADNGVVTQAQLDYTLRLMTAELYHVEPGLRGEADLSDFRFAAAATTNLPGSSPQPTDSIRRSTELNQMGTSEVLIPPPPPPRAGTSKP